MLILQIAAGVFIGLLVFHVIKHASVETLGTFIAICMGLGVLGIGGLLMYQFPALLILWLAVSLLGLLAMISKACWVGLKGLPIKYKKSDRSEQIMMLMSGGGFLIIIVMAVSKTLWNL
jgi:hypothetical protein